MSSSSEVLRQACADVFDDWIAHGTQRFVAAGVDEAAARAFVIEMIAALDGAFVLARATRRTEALDVVGKSCAKTAKRLLRRKRKHR